MENENFTIQFAEGFKPVTSIGSNGNWFIDGADTGCSSIGAEGPEPVITIVNDYWCVDGKQTDVKATANLAEMETTLAKMDDTLSTMDSTLEDMSTSMQTFESNTSTQVNDMQTTVNTCNTRMEALIPSGTQTEGNTELVDIRAGADGVTYASAGDAVRGQYSELNNNLTYDLGDYSYKENLIHYIIKHNLYTSGGYVNAYNGNIDNVGGLGYSNYLPVENITGLYANWVNSNGEPQVHIGAFYDSNKNFVSGIDAKEIGTDYKITENISYMRLTITDAEITEQDENHKVYATMKKLDWLDLSEVKEKINYIYDVNRVKTIVKKPFDFSGKSGYFFGDSITVGFTDTTNITENNYVKKFCDYVGMSYHISAFGGSCFTSGLNSVYTIPYVINANIGGLSDYDFVFVAGGVNDWGFGASLEDFKTAVDGCFSQLADNFDVNNVFIIAPLNNCYTNIEVAPLDDYRIILHDKAMLYGFNFINGADFGFPTESGELANKVFGDGVLHPSEFGYDMYSKGLLTVLC